MKQVKSKKQEVDHRISKRKTFKTRVVFEDELSEEFLYFLSTDISISGLFIESNIALGILSKVFLKFSLYEGQKPIQVTGEVVRVVENIQGVGRPRKDKKLGIGFRFLGLKADEMFEIEKFVNS